APTICAFGGRAIIQAAGRGGSRRTRRSGWSRVSRRQLQPMGALVMPEYLSPAIARSAYFLRGYHNGYTDGWIKLEQNNFAAHGTDDYSAGYRTGYADAIAGRMRAYPRPEEEPQL